MRRRRAEAGVARRSRTWRGKAPRTAGAAKSCHARHRALVGQVRAALRGADPPVHCTEIALAVGVASNTSVDGQTGHVTPRLALFGSPLRANAPMLRIIVSDSASRPGRFAVVYEMFAYSEGPKLPNANGRSNACAAP